MRFDPASARRPRSLLGARRRRERGARRRAPRRSRPPTSSSTLVDTDPTATAGRRRASSPRSSPAATTCSKSSPRSTRRGGPRLRDGRQARARPEIARRARRADRLVRRDGRRVRRPAPARRHGQVPALLATSDEPRCPPRSTAGGRRRDAGDARPLRAARDDGRARRLRGLPGRDGRAPRPTRSRASTSTATRLSEAAEPSPGEAARLERAAPGRRAAVRSALAFVVEADGLRLDGARGTTARTRFGTESDHRRPSRRASPATRSRSSPQGLATRSRGSSTSTEPTPDARAAARADRGVLGTSLDDDVLPLFAGEGALYVRPGAPIPGHDRHRGRGRGRGARHARPARRRAALFSGAGASADDPRIDGIEAAESCSRRTCRSTSPPSTASSSSRARGGLVDAARGRRPARRRRGVDDALDAGRRPGRDAALVYVDLGQRRPLFLGFARWPRAGRRPRCRERGAAR